MAANAGSAASGGVTVAAVLTAASGCGGAGKAVTTSVAADSAAAPNGKGISAESASDPASCTGDGVEELIGRLKLTAQEARPLILEDEDEPTCPEWALVGKVLAPSTLHIQTIQSALRPAWGNPKGLMLRSLGTNLFIAEFDKKDDKLRVLNGSPWTVGRHAVLFTEFDHRVNPAEVQFNRLALWVRILKLPFRLMNKDRGTPIAGLLGVVDGVEVDEKGRARGDFLRARVNIDITPFMRYVTVNSLRLKTIETYEVMYERMPLYCYSCGMLGHSSLVCPTPASRDADGFLPYHGLRMCVPDDRKKNQPGSWSSSFSSGQSSKSGSGQEGSSSRATPRGQLNKENSEEVSSPLKTQRPRKKAGTQGRVKKAKELPGKELFPAAPSTTVSGQKRKQSRVYKPKVQTAASESVITLAITGASDAVASAPVPAASVEGLMQDTTGSNKKQKNSDVISTPRSADQAECAE